MTERKIRQTKIAFFGHFGSSNFGNEITLKSILYHLRCSKPDAEVTCISTAPEATIAAHHVAAIPVAETFASWVPRNPLSRALRKVCIGLPNQLYQSVRGFIALRHTDMLIIPGTGLLTDAYGLFSWGPYNLFKWSLIAKACRCKLLFVSVGAGPIDGILGRWFVKSVLSLADFRSYRDDSTMSYLKSIGFRAGDDQVYPDLAFSLPEALIPHQSLKKNRRSVVGLGVMLHAGMFSVSRRSDTMYLAYLHNLATFVRWLMEREYDVRLIIGDLVDIPAKQEFIGFLREQLSVCDESHIIDEPICSIEDLLSQIVKTDLVVATRFHNVLLALLCNKPAISISFHHKCDSLMNSMGLSEYSLDINELKSDKLIHKFCDLEANAENIKAFIKEKAREFRDALDEQYGIIFSDAREGLQVRSRVEPRLGCNLGDDFP